MPERTLALIDLIKTCEASSPGGLDAVELPAAIRYALASREGAPEVKGELGASFLLSTLP